MSDAAGEDAIRDAVQELRRLVTAVNQHEAS
jgi:hypothetical protein